MEASGAAEVDCLNKSNCLGQKITRRSDDH
jgi:hypothetical protein